MQINRADIDLNQITFTISTDTVEYEPPVIVRYTLGEGGYAMDNGDHLTEEEVHEMDRLINSWLFENGHPLMGWAKPLTDSFVLFHLHVPGDAPQLIDALSLISFPVQVIREGDSYREWAEPKGDDTEHIIIGTGRQYVKDAYRLLGEAGVPVNVTTSIDWSIPVDVLSDRDYPDWHSYYGRRKR